MADTSSIRRTSILGTGSCKVMIVWIGKGCYVMIKSKRKKSQDRHYEATQAVDWIDQTAFSFFSFLPSFSYHPPEFVLMI